jgi:dipeptidyl-peptidase-4
MKSLLLILNFSFIFGYLVQAQLKEITLEDIYEKGTFSLKGVPGFNFTKDGLHFTRQIASKIVKYDIKSGSEKEVLFDSEVDANGLLKGKMQSYSFSADESKILLTTAREQIYRYSFTAEYYVYNLNTKKIQRIFPTGKVKYPALNPQGDKVAFVYENDLYYQDLNSEKITRVTKDGKMNAIINGASDWVYEEEFTLTRSFEWSPDGNQIAFLRFDESKVKEFTIEYYRNGVYPEPYTFKYPKVGEVNATLTVWNYNLKKKKLNQLNIGAREDDYIPRIMWTNDNNQLCVSWMNRDQNHLKLILANTSTGTFRVLLEEKNKYYVDIHDNLVFLKNGKFLWTSEMDGYNHLYLYDMSGKLVSQLTKGRKEITEFYGIDAQEKYALIQLSENDGTERKIYSVELEIADPSIGQAKLTCITNAAGTHSAQVSPGLKYMVLSSSDISSPPTYRIADAKGNEIRVLEQNAEIKEKMKQYVLSDLELTRLKNHDNVELNTIMIKPKNFDQNKKYPVFMFLYGGPGSQEVMNKWNSFGYYWWLQMLAQKGYIICIVDNRGTGGKGEEFKKMTYLQLGKYETEDQIDAAKYLASLPYVDGSRIGIFGWSYGGYMSSLCILKGNDVFKSAIAVAPVTNWKWYDSIYTERFMKRTSDNQKGYDENSPVNFADRLKGNYLLVHGMADDNVHFQNSAEMANALIKNKKQFDTYYYPNRNHGISGQNAKIHLFTKMTSFVLEKI